MLQKTRVFNSPFRQWAFIPAVFALLYLSRNIRLFWVIESNNFSAFARYVAPNNKKRILIINNFINRHFWFSHGCHTPLEHGFGSTLDLTYNLYLIAGKNALVWCNSEIFGRAGGVWCKDRGQICLFCLSVSINWRLVHTTYTRNNMVQICEGNCGFWVLNEII